MSDSVRPHRWQPTRFPRLWDSPGKNTGVGCHFLPQCMKVKSESEVAQSYLTLSDPMDCSLPGSIIHRIFQARVLELAPFHGLWQKTWDWVQSLRTVLLTSIAVTEISISVSYPSSSPHRTTQGGAGDSYTCGRFTGEKPPGWGSWFL